MDPLTLQTIADFAGGKIQQGDPLQKIVGISTDSRTVSPGEIFVALEGDNYDGRHFVVDALLRGATGAIMSGELEPPLPHSTGLIMVDDPLLAYQRIAARYRRLMPMKLVAITGSNGKTSTKDFTAAVLSKGFRVVKTSGNYNNHIGVPQTLLRATASDQICVLEIGMNHPGEIAPLASIAQPDVAVITNIGTAHIEFLKTRGAIATEKGALAEAVPASGHVVLPAEDEYSAQIAKRTAATTVMVGFSRGEIRAEEITQDGLGMKFALVAGDQRVETRLKVPGKHMVLNALLAVAVGQIFGLSLEDSAENLNSAVITKGRLEMKEVSGLKFLDDTYNANPDSMVAALQTLARMPTTGKRIAILGAMGELGSESDAGHLRVGQVAAREQIDHIIGVGPESGLIVEGARLAGSQNTIAVADVAEAAAWIKDFAGQEDLILIKGSRSAGMERILALISTDNHQSRSHL